ncbi:OB-fold protein [Actinomyces sp. zg-332]|uniref:OB-fold protein n=1 Tax=Actinomyces sp. zg-332 TaxID=2708340 RepID=UPI003FA4610D
MKGNAPVAESSNSKEAKKEETKNYETHEVRELTDDLEANALKATEKYEGKYVELKGKLGIIDSSGEYFQIVPFDDEFGFDGVQ